ncbi:hypothetical protein L1987_36459 [Smallanthus sonchifolius]|uniref:Uncharacterized protein n=1 Tax=Smallanthus sonchifolius TaxID=185202 RepID=A0ACB9HEB7_9ASTR|nr:hypothetical protein L1987_36459 [Smallanthus sonchifolius]
MRPKASFTNPHEDQPPSFLLNFNFNLDSNSCLIRIQTSPKISIFLVLLHIQITQVYQVTTCKQITRFGSHTHRFLKFVQPIGFWQAVLLFFHNLACRQFISHSMKTKWTH